MSECFSSFIVRTLPSNITVSIVEVLSELVKQTVFHAPSNSVVVSLPVDYKVIPKLRLLVSVPITRLRDSP